MAEEAEAVHGAVEEAEAVHVTVGEAEAEAGRVTVEEAWTVVQMAQ